MQLPETNYELSYTICFCIAADKVLMLHRIKPPNPSLWNGVGGKIEPGETPEQANFREVLEETEIDLNNAKEVFYAGTVTWDTLWKGTTKPGGMYCYIAELPEDAIDSKIRNTNEGKLEWKPIEWAIDKNNTEVVKNIPHFLPEMLKKGTPKNHHGI